MLDWTQQPLAFDSRRQSAISHIVEVGCLELLLGYWYCCCYFVVIAVYIGNDRMLHDSSNCTIMRINPKNSSTDTYKYTPPLLLLHTLRRLPAHRTTNYCASACIVRIGVCQQQQFLYMPSTTMDSWCCAHECTYACSWCCYWRVESNEDRS